jgi:predicted nucleic acid-binding protein
VHALDASAIIHAWDNYPPAQFPGLWGWLATEISAHRLTISVVALEEVGHKYPECASWLKSQSIRRLPMDNEVIHAAMQIKTLAGIQGEQYNPKGVDENDIFIIASAQYHGVKLVTNEARQFGKQTEPTRRKIPAVCDLPGVQVVHLNFLDYIRQSQQVF